MGAEIEGRLEKVAATPADRLSGQFFRIEGAFAHDPVAGKAQPLTHRLISDLLVVCRQLGAEELF